MSFAVLLHSSHLNHHRRFSTILIPDPSDMWRASWIGHCLLASCCLTRSSRTLPFRTHMTWSECSGWLEKGQFLFCECRLEKPNQSHPTALSLPELIHHRITRRCYESVANPSVTDLLYRHKSQFSSIKVIRRHQQLQAQLARNLHVWHAVVLLVLLIVVQILDYLFEHNAGDGLEMADARRGFGHTCSRIPSAKALQIDRVHSVASDAVRRSVRGEIHTSLKHPPNSARDASGRATDVKFKAIGRDERDEGRSIDDAVGGHFDVAAT